MQQYLYSKGWDTRIAASETLGLLAEAFPHPSVADLAARCQELHGYGGNIDLTTPMTFSTFNLQLLLDKGTALLASGGQVRSQFALCWLCFLLQLLLRLWPLRVVFATNQVGPNAAVTGKGAAVCEREPSAR